MMVAGIEQEVYGEKHGHFLHKELSTAHFDIHNIAYVGWHCSSTFKLYCVKSTLMHNTLMNRLILDANGHLEFSVSDITIV